MSRGIPRATLRNWRYDMKHIRYEMIHIRYETMHIKHDMTHTRHENIQIRYGMIHIRSLKISFNWTFRNSQQKVARECILSKLSAIFNCQQIVSKLSAILNTCTIFASSLLDYFSEFSLDFVHSLFFTLENNFISGKFHVLFGAIF